MPPRVWIACARDEEPLVEKLAGPLRAAGYDVAHEGTVLVGESVVAETARVLEEGGPVVLCGTERAAGNRFVRTLAQAARRADRGRLFIVQMEPEADIESLVFGEKIASYWQNPDRAIGDLLNAIRRYYPLDEAEAQQQAVAGTEERYRSLLLKACDIINLANLPDQDRHVALRQHELKLRGLYIPLRVQVEVTDDAGADGTDALLEKLEERRLSPLEGWPLARAAAAIKRVSIGERLAESRRLVVLGDPGSGKTTLTRWIATAYLLRLKQDDEWKDLPDVKTLPAADWLPIMIRCRDLTLASLTGSLDDILKHTLRRFELSYKQASSLCANLTRRLADASALLMLDGLDEITDPAVRARFCQHLEQIVSAYPDAPVIATSRIVGYREMGYRLGSGFEHVTLIELTPGEQDDFARRWCRFTEIPERWEEAAQELIRDIHITERIERLTGNPMLLTTMALVKRKVGKLPNRRADLYWEAVQVLLNWRREVDAPIDSREAIPQLEYLAYAMCDRGVPRLRRDEILDYFARMREEYPNVHAARASTPEDFLKRLETRTGILIEAGHVRHLGMLEPIYEFRHLTFQEYLAARALVDNKFPGRDPARTLAEHIAPLAGRTADTHFSEGGPEETAVVTNWREALRLCVAICADDVVDAVLLSILNPQPGEAPGVARARAVLATMCLTDEPNVDAKTAGQVAAALAAQVGKSDGNAPPKTALEAAAGQIGGTRWEAEFKRALLERYYQFESVPDFSAGVVAGLVGALRKTAGDDQMQAWLVQQETRLRADDEMGAIDAAFSISQTLVNRLAGKWESGPIPEIADALLDRLSSSAPAAIAASAALFCLSNHPAWKPTRVELDRIIDYLRQPASAPEPVQMLALILGQHKVERAAGALIPWLDNAKTRRSAALALADIGTPDAITAVSAFIGDPDPRMRRAAFKASLVKTAGSDLALLTRKLDGSYPFLDPAEPITVQFAQKAADTLGIPLSEAQSRYENLAGRVGLRLEWREGEMEKKPARRTETGGAGS